MTGRALRCPLPTRDEALRRIARWRKRSFSAQSEMGSRFVERILTVITTLRQQGRGVLEFLTADCQNALGQNHTLCLLPAPALG
jgi:transposase